MKKLDAAAAKRIAPSALMVLIAGPIFLFLAVDLLMFAAMSGARAPTTSNQVADLSMEIVLCGFTGLLASFGVRNIWRELKK